MNKLGMRLKERLTRSAFFFGAVLLHLVIFLMVLGYIIFPAPPAPDKDTTFEAPKLPHSTPPPQAPSPAPSAPDLGSVKEIVSVNPEAGAPPSAISPHDVGPDADIHPGIQPGHDPGPPASIRVELSPDTSPVDLQAYKIMHDRWMVPGKADFMKFPIYLAKYADGDWDCNTYFHDGKLTSGCLPNLMAKIDEWSHGELNGRNVKVVALDSKEILDDPPPFIFFTGHKDFHLTPTEIDTLHKYLVMGGVIWGDSAFAGDGSRFDVAFHREMKYVLPDADIQFESLAVDHDIFTRSRFQIDSMPPGMNRRADPIECMNLGGKLAVLYTPNDYSDMMTMLLQPGLNEREAQMDGWNHWEPQHPLFTPSNFTWHAATFYRNYDPPAVMSTYKLSMNILVHLLHRYDDALLLTP